MCVTVCNTKRMKQENAEQGLDKHSACPQSQRLIHFLWSCLRLCFDMTLQIRLLCFGPLSAFVRELLAVTDNLLECLKLRE